MKKVLVWCLTEIRPGWHPLNPAFVVALLALSLISYGALNGWFDAGGNFWNGWL